MATTFLKILDLVPSWVYALALIALGAANGVLLWENKDLQVDLSLQQVNVSQLQAAIAGATAHAAQESATLTKKVLDAQNEAKKREIALRADVQHARDALDSLRHAADVRRAAYRLTGVPPSTSTDAADTALDLLLQCSERYTALAAAADGHASDIKTLTDAWPKR